MLLGRRNRLHDEVELVEHVLHLCLEREQVESAVLVEMLKVHQVLRVQLARVADAVLQAGNHLGQARCVAEVVAEEHRLEPL